jgi:tetratricopeptide (TPR) repeat protein
MVRNVLSLLPSCTELSSLRNIAASAVLSLIIGACAYEPPHPTQTRIPGQPTTSRPAESPAVSPGQPPKPGDLPTWTEDRPTAPRSPVAGLMAKANSQMDAGELEQAQATLERALRIAPYDPLVLTRLAEVKLELGSPAQAEALANKSNGLVRGDEALRTYNNQLIDAARRAQGRR